MTAALLINYLNELSAKVKAIKDVPEAEKNRELSKLAQAIDTQKQLLYEFKN